MDGGADNGHAADAACTTHRPPNVIQPSAEEQIRPFLRPIAPRPISPTGQAAVDGASSPRGLVTGLHPQQSTQLQPSSPGLPPRPPKISHPTHAHTEAKSDASGERVISERPVQPAEPGVGQCWPLGLLAHLTTQSMMNLGDLHIQLFLSKLQYMPHVWCELQRLLAACCSHCVGSPIVLRPRSADPWSKRMQQQQPPPTAPEARAQSARRLSEGGWPLQLLLRCHVCRSTPVTVCLSWKHSSYTTTCI
jgi:hypothetical protein